MFEAAEMLQQFDHGLLADSWNQVELAAQAAGIAAGAMERHGEAMRFVAHRLDQVQHR